VNHSSPSLLQKGYSGETHAIEYLQKCGFTVVARNVRNRFGEIDIVAVQNEKIHFIEVKTRVGTSHGMPYEAVTYGKIKRLRRTIELYLLQNKVHGPTLSLDVVSIILDDTYAVLKLQFFENITSGRG
jgi:putative endonuclease